MAADGAGLGAEMAVPAGRIGNPIGEIAGEGVASKGGSKVVEATGGPLAL